MWRRSSRFLFRGAELNHLRFQTAIRVFPIRTADFFVIDDVAEFRAPGAFGYHRLVGDFENARRLFPADCERLILRIDGRNHPVKGNWPIQLLAWGIRGRLRYQPG